MYQGSKKLPSLKRRSSRLSLVFWGVSVFPWLGILSCVVILLITIETSDIIQVFACYADNVGGIDIGG